MTKFTTIRRPFTTLDVVQIWLREAYEEDRRLNRATKKLRRLERLYAHLHETEHSLKRCKKLLRDL